MDFDAPRAAGQFLLSRDGTEIPGWARQCCAGWTLFHHPDLPVVEVLDARGQQGWLIGHAVSPTTGRMQAGPVQLTSASAAENEEQLYAHGGRFACILVSPTGGRVYLDAAGSLAAVYSPERQRVGSTTTVVLIDEPDHPMFAKSLREFPNQAHNQYYPAGLTAAADVDRLLPNHYLDLGTWEPVRHWPTTHLTPMAEDDVGGAVSRIATLMQRNIMACFNDQRRVYCGLTGGMDTRMVAAAADHRKQIDFITFDYEDGRHSRVDIHLARKIARSQGWRLDIIPTGKIDASAQRRYLELIGYQGGAGKGRDFMAACEAHLDMGGAWLPGFGGEVSWNLFGRPDDSADMDLDAEGMLGRLRLSGDPRLLPAIAGWLDELPDMTPQQIIAIAYIELRMGCWASPHMYGTAPFAIQLLPFCHREIFELMLRLPPEMRARKGLAAALVPPRLPALSRYPYGKFPGFRGLVDAAERRIRRAVGTRR